MIEATEKIDNFTADLEEMALTDLSELISTDTQKDSRQSKTPEPSKEELNAGKSKRQSINTQLRRNGR